MGWARLGYDDGLLKLLMCAMDISTNALGTAGVPWMPTQAEDAAAPAKQALELSRDASARDPGCRGVAGLETPGAGMKSMSHDLWNLVDVFPLYTGFDAFGVSWEGCLRRCLLSVEEGHPSGI